MKKEMKDEDICAICLIVIGGFLVMFTHDQDICTAPDGSECPATADNTCAPPCSSTFHVPSQQIAGFVLFGIAASLCLYARFIKKK